MSQATRVIVVTLTAGALHIAELQTYTHTHIHAQVHAHWQLYAVLHSDSNLVIARNRSSLVCQMKSWTCPTTIGCGSKQKETHRHTDEFYTFPVIQNAFIGETMTTHFALVPPSHFTIISYNFIGQKLTKLQGWRFVYSANCCPPPFWTTCSSTKSITDFLPRVAMRKRGTICRPVSVCLSVYPTQSCIVSKRLRM